LGALPERVRLIMHNSETLKEADRLMTICNSCRYCEGLCAVFPAMELRRSFTDGDINYLANLCHSCGACYHDCQFSPPHEFEVNVPRVMAQVRAESYRSYAWPRCARGMFERNGLAIALVTALSIAAFIGGFVWWHDPAVMFGTHVGEGAFFRLMPHNAMVALFGAISLYVLIALFMGFRAFWKDIGSVPNVPLGSRSLFTALHDILRLRYLDGGGVGCFNDDEKPTDRRRLYHHLTFYGFMLCFAATCVATLYHYVRGVQAPYAWYDLPVVLGTLGGIGLIIGPIGLMKAKLQRDPMMVDRPRLGMDSAFIVMLFLTSLTGLLLLMLRATPAMGTLLALHLGVVFSLFLTMPYSKFVHGLYRAVALVRYAWEFRQFESSPTEVEPKSDVKAAA
jgi:citrate/tricarballylate utilization protein